jgi:hypothetical protein
MAYTPLEDVGSIGKGIVNTAVGANMSVAAFPRPRIVGSRQPSIGRHRIVYSSSYSPNQQQQ